MRKKRNEGKKKINRGKTEGFYVTGNNLKKHKCRLSKRRRTKGRYRQKEIYYYSKIYFEL